MHNKDEIPESPPATREPQAQISLKIPNFSKWAADVAGNFVKTAAKALGIPVFQPLRVRTQENVSTLASYQADVIV
ncbi:MAG: hypothetical protein FWG05_03820, partial [Kiritimatiellaeota bacterium]|nr:hypothetical protein [Kiritimatiellota bacterium]